MALQPISIVEVESFEWPDGAIDRLTYRVIEQAIKDARAYARRGVCEANPPLRWLWDTGRSWAETLGDDGLRLAIINTCEDIEILAYSVREKT